jgi:hypothetical protein
VIGVLDWEAVRRSAIRSSTWRSTARPGAWRPTRTAACSAAAGRARHPGEAEYLERYYALAGSRERMTTFHQVFAMFRGAVGSAGVAMRGEGGNAFLPDAARIGRKLALAYATRGLALIESA